MGTLINAAAIIVATILGILFKKRIIRENSKKQSCLLWDWA